MTRYNLKVDPIFAHFLKEMKPGDILGMDGHRYKPLETGSYKTHNYTMRTRKLEILDDVPHWFPQFRCTVKPDPVDKEGTGFFLIIDNLFALPRGYKSLSYRHKGRKLIFTVQAEELPDTMILGTIGQKLRDVIGWNAIPESMIISDASQETIEQDLNKMKSAPRASRQKGLTDQIHFTVEEFDWRPYSPGEFVGLDVPLWNHGPFRDAEGNQYQRLSEIVAATHPDPVDARLCYELAGQHPHIAILHIENALNPGGSSYSPHLCLKQGYYKFRTFKHLFLRKGSWIRRDRDDTKDVEWMIPLEQASCDDFRELFEPYQILILDEDGRISAYRIRDSISPVDYHVNVQKSKSLIRRGIESNIKNRKLFKFDT